MADLPISGLPAITVVSDSYLLAAVSESVTAQMTVKQVGDAYSSSLSLFPYVGAAEITGSLSITGSTAFTGSNTIVGGLKINNFTGFEDPASLQFRTYHEDTTTDGAWYSWGTEFLQMGPINSGVDGTYTMAFVPADNSTGYIPVDRPSLLFNADSQIYLNGSKNFRIYSPSTGKTLTVLNMATALSGSLTVSGSTSITGSLGNGLNTITPGAYSHAEGFTTEASGIYSHAEGSGSIASGNGAHAEGVGTSTAGHYSHAEGSLTQANGYASHAEGSGNYAEGNYSHAEGAGNTAQGNGSHAEGNGSTATGQYSHAEGSGTAVGASSHAEGTNTIAYGQYSHAEGNQTTAYANYSHAEGFGTIASASYFSVVGTHNLKGNANSIFVIGDGLNDSNRHDLLRAEFGQVQITGSLFATGSATVLYGPSTTLSSSFYIQSSSLFNQSTGSSLVSYDTASGQLFHTTYQSVLPALFAAGAFYSTGSISTTANQSGSFTYTTTLGVNSVNVSNGSRINVDRNATYNFQFSIQIHNKSQAVNIAVWLKKNGVNVADTATYIDVPSNEKSFLALNLWDTATAGDYYEIAYQADQDVATLFETQAASGNIPLSPSIIVTVNQVR